MSANNHQDIIAGLARVKASGAYHDFVIHCGDRSWKVHRLVICSQSEFFRKACDGNFEEARKGEMTLAENDPDIVERMIDYLYLSDYNDVAASTEGFDPNDCRLWINALVYAIAGQYAIPHLQTVARKKTEAALACNWKEDGTDESFVKALDLVWTTTPQSGRGLRNCYLAFVNSHTAELRNSKSFFELLRSNADFMVNVVESAWDAAPTTTTRTTTWKHLLGSDTQSADGTQDVGWPSGKKGKDKGRWS